MNKKETVEWLSTLKVGDEVCFTNEYNLAYVLFGALGDPNKEDRVCKISEVRGILSDGCIVVADTIFNKEGKIENVSKSEFASLSMDGELVKPTDKLRELARRLKFIETFKIIDWNKIDTDAMNKIVMIINDSVIANSKESAGVTYPVEA